MIVNRLSHVHRLALGGFLFAAASGVSVMGPSGESVIAADVEADSGSSVEADLQRISPKRTVLTVDFGGGARVGPGGKVIVTAGGKSINGTVRKITPRGRSIIRLKSALPNSVETGTVSIRVVDPGDASGMVTIAGPSGGGGKWHDRGFLSGYSKAGFSGLAEVGIAPMSGTTKVTGGTANEKVNFGESAMDVGLDGRARYSMGAFGGGLHFIYMSGSSEGKASVNTASTGSKDSDSIKEKSSAYQVAPNIAYNGGAFAVGLGLQMGKSTVDRTVKIASVEGPGEPVTISENAALVELRASIGSVKFGVNALVAGKGKLTEKNQKDVDRMRSGFGAHVLAAAGGLTHRVGFDYAKVTDKYTSSNLTNTSMGIDLQTQATMSSLSLTPRLAYDWSNVDFGSRKGKESNLAIGSRVSFGSPYAGFELRYKNREQDAYGSAPSYKTSLLGAGIAGGMTF